MFKKGGELVDIFLYPARCVGCGLWYSCESDAWWCDVCEGERLLAHAVKKEVDGLCVYAAHKYETEPVARAIHAFKYAGIVGVGTVCGEWALDYFETVFRGEGQKIIIVPVPLHSDRLYERGFNQAEIIAREIVARSKLNVVLDTNVVVRAKYTSAQAKLDEVARKEQMKDVFVVSGLVDMEATYVIVDDVVTTGSTIEACARSLKNAGAARIFGFCVAGTVVL